MKLIDQVASLSLCQQLKTLGVKQDGLFNWIKTETVIYGEENENGDWIKIPEKTEYEFRLGSPFAWDVEPVNTWSAFTVAELGIFLQWEKIYIFGLPEQMMDFVNGSNTEADARAQMLIHLIENKLMKLPT